MCIDMGKLNTKIALVIGGSRGIGAGIVRRLAANSATVVFTFVNAGQKAISSEKELADQGYLYQAIQADSTDTILMQGIVE